MNFKPIFKIALISILLGGGFFVFFFLNPSQHVFLPCAFHYATGLYCPGCGSQRALHQLLHLNFVGAFRLNPLLVLTLPLLAYGLGITVMNYVFETQYRFRLFYNKIFIYGYFGLALLYWILRNLPYYPFTLLAPSE